MSINLTKLTQAANITKIAQKAGVSSASAAAPKFNTGILDKDTAAFTTAAKKAIFPFTDETTQVAEHHNINGCNNSVRDILTKIEEGGKEGRYDWIILDIIQDIDAQFAKLPPLEDNFTFYRGRSIHPIIERFNRDFDIIDAAKAGDVIVPDKAYSYGAFKKELAEHWAGDMMMEIHVPKGAKVSRNMEHGGEVVFPRGAEYRLISKEKDNNGILNVVLEYILPEK